MIKRCTKAHAASPIWGARRLTMAVLLACAALLLGACNANQTAERLPTAIAETADQVPSVVAETADQIPTVVAEVATAVSGVVETIVPDGDQGLEAISFSDIADNPEEWVGRRVTVRGDLDTMVGRRAFTLNEPGLGADRFLVVAQATDTIPMEEPIFGQQATGVGEQVQVTGVVQRYDLPAVERSIGADLQDDLFAAYTPTDLVIIASSIHVIGDQALPGQEDGEAAQVGDQIPEQGGGSLTVARITENPQRYEDQVITISGDAEEMIGTRAFRLDEDNALAGGIDNDLLVIGATLTAPQFDNGLLNEQVTVTGTLRMFNREQLGPNVGYDLDANLFTAWEDKPVLVAEAVTPIN